MTAADVSAPVAGSSRRFSLPYLTIVVVSLVAWGPILLAPNAKFWDDWVLANTDTLRMTREIGLPWVGYLDNALFAIGPWSFKVLVIASTITVGCALFAISGRRLGLSYGERWLLSTLVVALPLFATRTLAAESLYAWSLALFMLGWLLIVRRDPSTAGRVGYIVGAVLLFVSYTTASLLPFTALPVAHLAWLAARGPGSFWRRIGRFIGRFWYLFATPVVFWIVRTLFFQPYGLYAGYNSVGTMDAGTRLILKFALVMLVALVVILGVLAFWAFATRVSARRREALALGALSVATVVLGGFLYATRVSTSPLVTVVPVCLMGAGVFLFACAVAVLVSIRAMTLPESRDRSVVVLLGAGLAILLLAMLPYLIVGKLPTFEGWETRHQLLMPFGVAAILVAAMRALRALVPRFPVRALSAALVIVFAALSLSVTFALVADSRKQSQVIEQLAANPLVRSGRTIVFTDLAPQLNYDEGSYSFYEYDGWLITAFGNEKRLGVDHTGVESLLHGGLKGLQYAANRYGFAGYTRTTDGVSVKIEPVAGANWFTLLLNEPSVKLVVTPIKDLSTVR